MNTTEIQIVLATTYYTGVIDGIRGPKQMAAVGIIERNGSYNWTELGWSDARRSIAAAQVVLDVQGHEPGVIDGLSGHNTQEAFVQFLGKKLGTTTTVDRTPLEKPVGYDKSDLPRQKDMQEFYGNPGDESNMAIFLLPFDVRLDYDLSTFTRKIRVHKKCGDALVGALTEVRSHYGAFRYRQLGLDRYAGGFVDRKMRGSNSWSTHAYGCATDWYAQPNGLRTRCPDALFCGAEYKDFLDIMESWNWLPAIRLWGADAMHFQQARL